MSTAATPYNQSTNFLFNPTSISSCCLWLDASYKKSLVYTAGKLSQWNDLSPRGFNASQANATYQPVVNGNAGPNGLTTVSFNGTQNMSISSNMDFGPNNWFIFAAVKIPTLNSAGHTILGKNAFQTLPQYRLSIDIYNDVEFIQYTPTTLFISSNASPTGNQWTILSAMGYTSGSVLYYNGTPKNTTAALNGSIAMTAVTNYLGSANATGTNCWNSDIGEIIIYSNNNISTLQRQQVEGYLAWKWGAQSLLPTTHPYYNNAYLSNSYPISYFPPRFAPTSTVPSVPGFTIPTTIRQYIYNPLSISGMALWLDASDKTTITPSSGGNVTSWLDKSGNNKDPTFSGTNTYNPISNTVYTSGTSYLYSAVDTRKTTVPNMTVFIVHRQTNNTSPANQGLWGNDIGGGWNRFQLLNLSVTPAQTYAVSGGYSGGPLYYNVPNLNTLNKVLYTCTYSINTANASYVNINGSNSVTFTENSAQIQTTTQNTYFGTIDTGINANVEFYEILLYTNSLTIQQTQQIEGYLAWKWNLQSNLPNSHPFYLFPPG